MNRKIVKILLMALALAGSKLCATDFHAPLPSTPMRYDFEKVHDNKSKLNFWTTGYMREADKAYMKHGFNTKPYTTLIFGKSEFNLGEAFEGAGAVDLGYTKKGQANLYTTKVAPRASFTERGLMLGACLAYPVWHNKGRVGVRGVLPLRNVRVEKDDEMEHAAVGLQQDVIKGAARKINATAANANLVMTGISSYRVAFLQKINTLNAAGCVVPLIYATSDVNKDFVIAGQTYQNRVNAAGSTGGAAFVIIKALPGTVPYDRGGAGIFESTTDTSNVADIGGAPTGAPKDPIAAGANGSVIAYNQGLAAANDSVVSLLTANGVFADANRAYVPGRGVAATDYSALLNSNGANRANINDLWITTIHGPSGAAIPTSQSRVNLIDNALMLENRDITSFLTNNGYAFQTYNITGLGDADVDLFYSHDFCESCVGELYAGVKLPTGAGDKYYGNPYKVLLGNGDHFEIKVGGKVAWDTCNWLNVKLDAKYNFVLEATEHRMAAYKGATIKNVGPKADADVNWGYFTGNFDFTFFHPKTKDISTTVGYELYYKTEDRISYKEKTSTAHWLGQRWTDATGKQADATTAGTKWTDFTMELDSKVARANTESIGHRAYVEGSYDFSEYLRMYFGGKYTFAGQNIPCEGEAYTGFNVKF